MHNPIFAFTDCSSIIHTLFLRTVRAQNLYLCLLEAEACEPASSMILIGRVWNKIYFLFATTLWIQLVRSKIEQLVTAFSIWIALCTSKEVHILSASKQRAQGSLLSYRMVLQNCNSRLRSAVLECNRELWWIPIYRSPSQLMPWDTSLPISSSILSISQTEAIWSQNV